MEQEPLSLGLECARLACEEDAAQRWATAVRHYDLAINYLTRALQDPQHASNQAVIAQKIREYADRRAYIGAQVSAAEAPAPAAVAAAPKEVSINDVLRLAFDVAAHARKEDAMGNLKGAFELYTQALESFMVVYKQEHNATLKEQLKSTILEYTTRAEQLKEMLMAMQHQQQQQQQLQMQQQQGYMAAAAAAQHQHTAAVGVPRPSTTAPSGIRNQDVDGPYSQTLRKQHPGHSGVVNFTVGLPKRKWFVDDKIKIHVDVDNQCNRQVESIKAYLTCNTDSYYWRSPDAQERKQESLKVLPREFTFGKVFPLQHSGHFEGDFEYELGPRLKPTDRLNPTVLVREYVLVVKCYFKRPYRDLKAYTPITISSRE